MAKVAPFLGQSRNQHTNGGEGAQASGSVLSDDHDVATDEELTAVAAMEWRTLRVDFVCADQQLVERVMGRPSFKHEKEVKAGGGVQAKEAKAHLDAEGGDSDEKVAMDVVTDSLQGFVMRWRRLFLETMQPAHMPKGWHVGHQLQQWKQPKPATQRAPLA